MMGRLPPDFQQRSHELIEAGHYLFQQGWVPATSGNFSARLSDGTIAITVSGRHKGRLHSGDIMVIDSSGQAQMSTQRPSAETPLHTLLYRLYPEVGAVLHTHSLTATLLSRAAGPTMRFAGYELLKAFAGITTHKTAIVIPNFPNDQDIDRLSTVVENYLEMNGPIYGYLINGHGLYTWGRSVDEALRHVEAFEFLFQCELHAYRG
ncbi:MAG TPA: methylthioribulose 1-phosphate dehydratase [Gammaproteobacteria bacterium]